MEAVTTLAPTAGSPLPVGTGRPVAGNPGSPAARQLLLDLDEGLGGSQLVGEALVDVVEWAVAAL